MTKSSCFKSPVQVQVLSSEVVNSSILASRTDEGGYVWDKSADGNAAPVGPETVWTMKAMNDVFDRNAYSFTISKAGNYTLTINGETLKLTIKCNDPWE